MEISRLVNDIILRNGNLMERDIGYDGIDGISVICCATTISLSLYRMCRLRTKAPIRPQYHDGRAESNEMRGGLLGFCKLKLETRKFIVWKRQ